MLKVGIVGVGGMGPAFLCFNWMPETKVTAICDIDQEQLNAVGEKYGIPERYVRYDDMLRSDTDIVVIVTPIQVHGQQAIQALEAGKDVLCEYIAANTIEEGWRLVEAVEKSGRKYMPVETSCYNKQQMLVEEMVRAGKFGELYFGECDYIHECHGLYWRKNGSLTWRGQLWNERNGGFGTAIHTLYPLLQMFGHDDRVTTVASRASGAHTLRGRLRIEDAPLVLCRTRAGKLLKLCVDIVSLRPGRWFLSIQGTKGCYEGPRHGGDYHKVWLVDDCKKYEWKPLKDYEEGYLPKIWREPPEQLTRAGGHVSECYLIAREFTEATLNNRKTTLDVYDGLHITAVGLAAEESIDKDGAPVEVVDFERC